MGLIILEPICWFSFIGENLFSLSIYSSSCLIGLFFRELSFSPAVPLYFLTLVAPDFTIFLFINLRLVSVTFHIKFMTLILIILLVISVPLSFFYLATPPSGRSLRFLLAIRGSSMIVKHGISRLHARGSRSSLGVTTALLVLSLL
jgi:hypothetical protein